MRDEGFFVDVAFWDDIERRKILWMSIIHICRTPRLSISYRQFSLNCKKIAKIRELYPVERERLPNPDNFKTNMDMVVAKLENKGQPDEIKMTPEGYPDFKDTNFGNTQFKFNPSRPRDEASKSKKSSFDKRFYNAMFMNCMNIYNINEKFLQPHPDLVNLNIEFIEKTPTLENKEDEDHGIQLIINALAYTKNILGFDPFKMASDRFFGTHQPTDKLEKIYFETYRFSSTAKEVYKSFTVISPPNSKNKIPVFMNFFEPSLNVGKDTLRRTNAMIFGLQQETHIMGPDMKGNSFKTIILPNIQVGQPDIVGGTLTTDKPGHPIMAKILFLKIIGVTNHNELVEKKRLPIGPHDLSKIIHEIGHDNVDKFRNQAEMEIEGTLYMWSSETKKYDEINQKIMVGQTLKDLNKDAKEHNDRSDHSFFIIKKEGSGISEPFNPAEDKHYTFNAAIKVK